MRGETDFVLAGDCWVSNVCPSSGCNGEDSTRITELAHLIPPSTGTAALEAGRTDSVVTHDWHRITFANSYSQQPVVITAMQSFNGPNPAGFRARRGWISGLKRKHPRTLRPTILEPRWWVMSFQSTG